MLSPCASNVAVAQGMDRYHLSAFFMAYLLGAISLAAGACWTVGLWLSGKGKAVGDE